MTKGKFDFKEQMAVGDLGEKHFVQQFPQWEPKKSTDDLTYDFLLKDGRKVELKTDSYPMEKTKNFFMETFSDIKTGKVGGPSRAVRDGVNLFIYYYLTDKKFFIFNSVELNTKTEALIASGKYQLKLIPNKGWTAAGFALPRDQFADIVIDSL